MARAEDEARGVVNAVTRALTEPGAWPHAMNLLGSHLGGAGALAEIFSADGESVIIGPRADFFEDRNIAAYIEKYVANSPRTALLRNMSAPDIQYDDLIGPDQDLDRFPFYSEFLAPHGLRHYLALRLSCDDGISFVAVHRLTEDGHATGEQITRIGRLAPFLRSAFRVREVISETALAGMGLVAALASLPKPVIFLDRNGRVLFQNEAAVDLLAEAEVAPDAAGWLAAIKCWHDVAAWSTDPAAVHTAMPGTGLCFRVVDLTVADASVLGGGTWLVLPRRLEDDARHTLIRRHVLTAAEARVLDCLVRDLTATEAARELGLSVATVRTHTASLRSKVNCRRTQDVVIQMILEGWPRVSFH
ncbi:MAG: helix-turn-helix transcriptional regulator [Brucellaceae bacterium]|nr:helix-turn-helix transcriptional regulator [Brucellaceae bacterium]